MIIKLDKEIYSRQVLLKTAYSFSDRAYLHLSKNKQEWIVEWTNMPNQDIVPEMFENELVSQQLREELIEKTRDIRTLLLSRAFASSIMDLDSPSMEEKNKKIETINEDDEKNASEILKGWFDK